MTVQFHLEAPNGNFPYLVSSDNYNAIIVPKGTDFAKWQSTFIGTGAFKLGQLHAERRRDVRAQPELLGHQGAAVQTSFKFYTSQPPHDPGAAGRRRRRGRRSSCPPGATALLNNSSYKIIKLKSANHRELSMRNDMAPFTDAAGAPGGRATRSTGRRMVQALLSGDGERRQRQPVRADASRPPTRPSRSAPRTSPRPSSCWRRPATPTGSSIKLDTEQYQEIPQLATVIAPRRQGGRDQHHAERRDPDALLRQEPRTATPTGSTGR